MSETFRDVQRQTATSMTTEPAKTATPQPPRTKAPETEPQHPATDASAGGSTR